MHHLSQVGFARPCKAFCAGNSGEEEEEEIKLELGEAAVVQISARQARNGLLTSPSWSPSRIQPPKNEPIQPLLFLPVPEPQVLLGEDFLIQLVDALVLGNNETHVRQIRL